jgi:endonuclease/exonuclease/phosphatase family metal-dependent hydrolase
MTLKVISWNIRHGLGLDGKQDISRIADELLKRDADIYAIQEVDIDTRRSGRVNQLEYLSERLGMEGHFTRFFGYDDGDYGLATFTKHPILNVDELILFSRLSKSNRALNVDIHFEGQKISHYNFHLPGTRSSICWRNIMKYKFPTNSILSGDFNSTPNTSDMQRLKRKWKDINEQETCPGWDIIDYNLSDMTPIETRIYETVASDHNMLETKYYL